MNFGNSGFLTSAFSSTKETLKGVFTFTSLTSHTALNFTFWALTAVVQQNSASISKYRIIMSLSWKN
jgi:hypothetical protein